MLESRLALALLSVATLASLAAAVRARAAAGTALSLLGLCLALAAFAAGTLSPLPPPARVALWLYGVAALGKSLALSRHPRGPVPFGRGALFLALWPGLDPAASFTRDPEANRGLGLRRALVGVAEVAAAFGLATISLRAGWLDAAEPVPSWARASSFVLLLDGGFRAAMGGFRAAGLRSEDVFREPWKMSDLADFWGRRWNRFVGDTLALEVFRPLRRRVGRVPAVLATFFMSGVLHEAVLGVAARDPDGRYMAFFLAHGVAVVLLGLAFRGRRRPGGQSILSRAAAWAVLLATAPLFFEGPYPQALPLEHLLP